MPDSSATALGPLLSALRTLPVYMLCGLAFAGYAVLFLPAFGGIDITHFRAEWGVWVWIEAVTFSILTGTRIVEAGATNYQLRRKSEVERRALIFVPRHHQCWWHLAKQQDDTFVSQLVLDVEAANLTDHPVRIVKARLVHPRMKGELLHGEVSLPKVGSPYHSSEHAIPPHEAVTASLHVMVRGCLAAQGNPVRVTIGITDQYGNEYKLRGLQIGTHDVRAVKQPWKQRLRTLLSSHLMQRQNNVGTTDTDTCQPAIEWQHGGRFDEVDLVLKEERRSYIARGRSRGELGSLNVGLQSEPNLGWTTVGDIPLLLWDEKQAKTIGSENLARLIALHGAHDREGRADLEQYLLSHLRKSSPFVEISYFVFLALHRMGRTIDALREARRRLAGDKVYGYSNLLGVLSATISHEYFRIGPTLYPQLLGALEGDAEYNFRLIEKINLAQLRLLDLERNTATK